MFFKERVHLFYTVKEGVFEPREGITGYDNNDYTDYSGTVNNVQNNTTDNNESQDTSLINKIVENVTSTILGGSTSAEDIELVKKKLGELSGQGVTQLVAAFEAGGDTIKINGKTIQRADFEKSPFSVVFYKKFADHYKNKALAESDIEGKAFYYHYAMKYASMKNVSTPEEINALINGSTKDKGYREVLEQYITSLKDPSPANHGKIIAALALYDEDIVQKTSDPVAKKKAAQFLADKYASVASSLLCVKYAGIGDDGVESLVKQLETGVSSPVFDRRMINHRYVLNKPTGDGADFNFNRGGLFYKDDKTTLYDTKKKSPFEYIDDILKKATDLKPENKVYVRSVYAMNKYAALIYQIRTNGGDINVLTQDIKDVAKTLDIKLSDTPIIQVNSPGTTCMGIDEAYMATFKDAMTDDQRAITIILMCYIESRDAFVFRSDGKVRLNPQMRKFVEPNINAIIDRSNLKSDEKTAMKILFKTWLEQFLEKKDDPFTAPNFKEPPKGTK